MSELQVENAREKGPETGGGAEEKQEDAENPVAEPVEGGDPYAYLNSDGFCSENYKIEIKNLPKFYGIQQIRKLINVTLGLNMTKMKSPHKNSRYIFACFRSDEDRDKAMEVLSSYTFKGNKLSVVKSKPSMDPLVKKRRQDRSKEPDAKKQKLDERSIEEKLKDSTICYWNIPYEEQLIKKQNEVKEILKKIGWEILRVNPELNSWMEQQRRENDGLPCKLLDIRSGKNIDGYRNKCEFTIGINEENNLKTIGFRTGKYANGLTSVGPPDCLRHVPDAMKKAVKLFEQFIRASELDVYNTELRSGFYRQLMARTASDNQLMLVIGVHPRDESEERTAKLKEEIVEFFTKGDGKEANVTSLYYQNCIKATSMPKVSTSPEHLHGETHIYEYILGRKFRVSPEAFFQINSEGAEILYRSAMELAGPMEDSTVVDICCGTGSIGLSFAGHCRQVLGLEIVPEAIADAKENARANGIENAEFFDGKAEDILHAVFMRAENEDVVAVVDPPRAGLHNKAISMMRKVKNLTKLVYLSCNPQLALKNFVDLGHAQSKTKPYEALVPVKAVAVDMFPHTSHCELVIFFQRYDTLQPSTTD